MILKCFNYYTRNSGSILSLPKLAFIKCDILTLKFAHFLNLVEVNHEAFLVSVVHLNAFSAKNGPVVGTIEMHNTHIMRDAQFVISHSTLRGDLIEID